MAIVGCVCGHKTDSACSNYWRVVEIRMKGKVKATKCYARFDKFYPFTEINWKPGCGYKDLRYGSREWRFANGLIGGPK